ncbi:cytochrome-c peroxidase [Sphingobacterium sp. LRF_L2]|uniref:cytochrome-c peroxidase n=1 Tax=Sphingobacterium sp. LRF_L2 TaxID=3369421 RepID=UPI003F5E9D7D
MKKILAIISAFLLLLSCERADDLDSFVFDNPEIPIEIPNGFPALNSAVNSNLPTKFGVALGEKLFNEKRLSGNNTISCASCHNPSHAFADNNPKALGIYGREGLRNAPPIQNMAFMQFYNWDGNILQLEKQPLVPIITHEEMNSSILEVISKIGADTSYKSLFQKAFGDENISAERIYRSIAQYEYTLISSNSKYDRVERNEGEEFTAIEAEGFQLFKLKCASCHSTGLFTDQTFRNVGFPLNSSSEEAGRARVTGVMSDYMRFRVPSLRNIGYTAPYGSFGQFATLKEVLDYFDEGVLEADNLDPILKDNGNRIPLTASEKDAIISFLNTLNDESFVVD